MAPLLHSKIKRRLVVKCIIITREPLHIGIGKETTSISSVDLPLLKSEDKPIISGSSIRGALRAHLTRLLNSLPLDILKSEFAVEKVEMDEKEEREFAKMEQECRINYFMKVGVINKIFGASGFASPLKITEAVPNEKVEILSRLHIKMDIGTDHVSEGPFDIEAIPEQTKFTFKIIYDELDDPLMKDANLVFYKILLTQLARGIELHLGGMKSRGYGLCEIKTESVEEYTPVQFIQGTPILRNDVKEFVRELVKEVQK